MDRHSREQLVAEFGDWLGRRGDENVDPSDLGMLLDWKQDYGDGQPYRWRLADVADFLLDYCPRKVSTPPDLASRIPAGVAAAMTYLGERDLLRRGSDPADWLAEHALACTDQYLDAMSDPALFGMAKSVFAAGGGLDPDFDINAPGAIDQLIERANGVLAEPPDAGGAQPFTVGPVTVPGEEDRRASAAAAPALHRFRLLHQACAAPGLKLTKKGNLSLADARRLVELLDTGDVTDQVIGDRTFRLRSAAQVRGLSRWVEWAVAAGVIRRHRGRLVAVAAWLKVTKDPLAALDRAVDALQRIGPVSIDQHWDGYARLAMFVEDGAGRLLAELLDAAGPVEIEMLCGLVDEIVRIALRVSPLLSGGAASLTRDLLDRLAECGVVSVEGVTVQSDEYGFGHRGGGTVRLTPAGTPVAIRLAEQLGMDIQVRPDPAVATAAQLADLVGLLGDEEWASDVRTWAAAQPAEDAAAELVGELAGRPDCIMLSGLESLHTVLGASATPPVRNLLGGPHDAIAVLWLSQHGGLDPATVEPPRLLAGAVALFAALLDVEGPEAVLDALDGEHPDEPMTTIEQLWRSAHPRTGEVLTAIGTHHPDKRLAKAARKSAFKFNSRSG